MRGGGGKEELIIVVALSLTHKQEFKLSYDDGDWRHHISPICVYLKGHSILHTHVIRSNYEGRSLENTKMILSISEFVKDHAFR